MGKSGKPTPEEFRFRDKAPEDYKLPDLNPYLKAHREHGLPVLTAEQAVELRGKWSEHFGRIAPLHLEIGTGNGFFLAGRATQDPDFNWLGLELRFKRVVLTARKLEGAGVTDYARIARYNAHQLGDLFEDAEIDCVYVNHPDPWPKDRQAKNRLLSPSFFEGLARLVKPGGQFRLKTDHRINVEATHANASSDAWRMLGSSDDVNEDGAPWEKDIMTNYQRKFLEKGEPVYAVWLRRV
jgi:tRNA (guanine-N7-)-methyltransferase